MRAPRFAAWACLAALTAAPPAPAQADLKDLLAQQKSVAEANWKKLDIKTGGAVETEHLLVYSAVPKDKAAASAAALEKYYAVAHKALRFDPELPPWKGKLAVFVLPTRGAYTSYSRSVLKESPKPGDAAGSDPSGDTPSVAAGLPADADKVPVSVERRAGGAIAVALLKARAGKGSAVPEWVREGFAWAVSARANSADPAVAKVRARARALAPATSAKEAWGSALEGDALEAVQFTVAEYLAFSNTDGPKFGKLVGDFRPAENGETPAFADALKSADVDWAVLERNWKRFVAASR